MAKKNTPSLVTEFRRYLTAADDVALEILILDGVWPAPGRDRVEYRNAINGLARRFSGGYESSQLDDVISYDEHDAKIEAAHMIGLAMGLRLRGDALQTLLNGGAR